MFPPWLHLQGKCWIWGGGALFGIESGRMIGNEVERASPLLWVADQVTVDAEVELESGIDFIFFLEIELRRDDELAREWQAMYVRGDIRVGLAFIPEIRCRDGRGRAERNSKKVLDIHLAAALVADVGDNQFAVELGCFLRYVDIGNNLSHCELVSGSRVFCSCLR